VKYFTAYRTKGTTMKETIKNTVKTSMLTGVDPESMYKILEGVPGVDGLVLDEVIREVTEELAKENIIHWGLPPQVN
jgi:hypothetical protein